MTPCILIQKHIILKRFSCMLCVWLQSSVIEMLLDDANICEVYDDGPAYVASLQSQNVSNLLSILGQNPFSSHLFDCFYTNLRAIRVSGS